MNTILLAAMLALGIIGHVINCWCDRVLSIYPNGRITLDTMKDINEESKVGRLMQGTDPDVPFKSAMYGVAAIFLHYLGYAAIGAYVYQYQQILGATLLLCAAMFAVMGAGHHVKYALSAWVYIRSGCDHSAYQLFQEMYHRMPITKICYVGYILYIVILIVTIVMGATPMPIWMAAFTILPIVIVMFPLRIIGTMHISAIITFVMWLVMILR